MITVTIDDEGMRAALSRLAGLLGDMTPVMTEIGETLRDEALDAFRQQAAPTGAAWAPLAASTLTRRRGGGAGARILQDTGVLRNSITTQLLSSHAVAVGTRMEYAKFHQFGTRKMPARPMLGLSAEGRREVETTLSRALASALGGAA